jgi:uncharacterized protein (DUF488 family)
VLIYTFGYSGRQVSELLALCDQVDGCVVDVRYSPRSRNPTWTRKRLQEALGDRYAWFRGFGNLNYRSGGGIVLAGFEGACDELHPLLATRRSPILLCACTDAALCHRTVVARLLKQRLGVPVAEAVAVANLRSEG